MTTKLLNRSQIQRNLQLRIEEQAKQLKKMFDQHQQEANKSQNSDITSSHDDHHSTSLNDDDDTLNLDDDSEDTLFPSKISWLARFSSRKLKHI